MGWYPYGLSALHAAAINYPSDTIMAVLVRTGAGQYIPNTGHSGLNFVSAAFRAYGGQAVVSTKAIIASGSAFIVSAGAFTMNTVSGTGDFHMVVFYRSAATEAGSQLLTHNVLTSGITVNGGNVTFTPNQTGIGIIWGSA